MIDNILDQREEDYGSASVNFGRIGALWAVLLDLDQPIEPHMVALMMDALKTVRLISNPEHEDSWFDKIGYSTLGYNIVKGVE